MLPSEKLRVLLLLGFLSLVYGGSALILLDSLRRRITHAPRRSSRPGVWFRRIVLILAACGILCAAYAFFLEPYWLQVDQVNLATPRLRPGARPIRIVHISDLHCEASPRLETRLPGEIARLEPDLIVFTGDALNSPQGLPVFRNCMTRLAAIAPTFAVRGNFDSWFWNDLDLYAGTGVQELDAVRRDLIVNGNPLSIIGVPVGKEDLVPQLLADAPTDRPVIFLYHYPDLFPDVAKSRRVTLYCAGHTHGGQVALPGYGALVTLSRLGKRYESGLYRQDDTWLYVSRGIGMEAGLVPRVRFFARPETTLIELAPD